MLLELGRLSEQAQFQHPFDFSFRAFGDQSKLCKTLLSTCLATVYTLKHTGTSHRWD
jgi:hypothetical protein